MVSCRASMPGIPVREWNDVRRRDAGCRRRAPDFWQSSLSGTGALMHDSQNEGQTLSESHSWWSAARWRVVRRQRIQCRVPQVSGKATHTILPSSNIGFARQ